MLHIVMEIVAAAISGFVMITLMSACAHEFGKFIIESNETVIEDCSQN